MADCSRLGEIMSYAEMKLFTACGMPMGTVRWSGDASTTVAANIITRLGVEDDESMPHIDWITDTHFYLVCTGLPKKGMELIRRHAAQMSTLTLRLFYRRGTRKGFQHLGLIQFETTEEPPNFKAFRFKRLCVTEVQHAG